MPVTELDGRSEQFDAKPLPTVARGQPATDLAGFQTHARRARVSAVGHMHCGQPHDDAIDGNLELPHHLEAVASLES